MGNSWDLQAIERIKNVDKVRTAPERIIPHYTNAEGVAEHSARYTWAAQRVSGRVLDLGCGVGYGGQILLSSNTAVKEVIGVDVSSDALEYATRTYASESLGFVRADACRLPFSDHSFDAIVSFEAIEHVKEPVALFKEAKRTLRPGGKFLVSTPNKYLTSPLSSRPLNPHHQWEWYPKQFVGLAQEHFTIAGMYGQNWFSTKIFFHVFSRDLRTLLKVALDRLGMFYPLRRIYRRLHPYRPAAIMDSVETLLPGFTPEPFSRHPRLLPGVVIVEATS